MSMVVIVDTIQYGVSGQPGSCTQCLPNRLQVLIVNGDPNIHYSWCLRQTQ